MLHRLSVRLILALTTVVAVVGGVTGYLNVTSQKRELRDEKVLGAEQLSRSITSATWHAMLADQRQTAYDIMRSIGEKEGVKDIRIFNKDGRVTFSTDPNAPRQVDKRAEACFVCHAAEAPLVRVDAPSRARTFRAADGGWRLGIITPIYNERACSDAACHAHPKEVSVLGVLDLVLDFDRVEAQTRAIEVRTAIITCAAIAVMALLIVMTTRSLLQRPIRALIAGTRAVSTMDLTHKVEITSPAELAELATSFEVMRERLQGALAEINGFTHNLERKVEERTRQLGIAQRQLFQSEHLASLGRLAASVAHEINNPLAGVLNLAMLLNRIVKDDGIPTPRIAEVRRYLQQIADESSRAGRIVSDLLMFARHARIERAPTDVAAVIETTASLARHKLELAEVRLELELMPGLPQLCCDRSQLQQVLVNLIMNAADAMPGGGRVTVATGLTEDGKGLLLTVVDEGNGIKPEHLPHIFEPFFTTKDEGKGVGLGLAVVYGIIEAHSGRIDVESEVGKGTRFRVTLPFSAPSECERAAAAAGVAAAAGMNERGAMLGGKLENDG